MVFSAIITLGPASGRLLRRQSYLKLQNRDEYVDTNGQIT